MIAIIIVMLGACKVSHIPSIDYAMSAHRTDWSHHPVLGDPSFDAFKRLPGNPVLRGASPYEWPVNGFLFEDPVSHDWFVYVGEYAENYASDNQHNSVCTVYRSTNKGRTWKRLGGIFPEKPHVFDGDTTPVGSAPDVSVVYENGRYHMIYDYSVAGATWESMTRVDHPDSCGVGYAWADKPEGPFTCTPKPVYRVGDHPFYKTKYRRGYAATLIRRPNDWMVLMMFDSGPHFGWALVGITSPNPAGPYSEPVFLRCVEEDYFYPPLLEYFPAFSREGWVYAPATSVARNRNYQAIYRARTEDAMNPAAWETFQLGSVWHAEPVENEYYGIWGQTFSGSCTPNGLFNVMFPARDAKGMGTINLASRKWDAPFRKRGFVMSGHFAPSLSLLNQDYASFHLSAKMRTEGQVAILFGYQGILGPNAPKADAIPHPLSLSNYYAVRIEQNQWRLLAVRNGVEQSFAEGKMDGDRLELNAANETKRSRIQINGAFIEMPEIITGGIGLWTNEHSWMDVQRFTITGKGEPARRSYLYSEALLGAAQSMEHWKKVKNATFRHGEGAIANTHEVRAKWNVICSAFTLYAPKGPQYGAAQLLMDGHPLATLDFHADHETNATAVFENHSIPKGEHAIVLRPVGKSIIPLDSLETIQ